MRKIKLFMVLFLLVAGVSGAWAQSQSYVYKGVTAAYAAEHNSDDYYLYNVGTGTFLYVGSTWGTKGSLLYDDLGLNLKINSLNNGSSYRFQTPMKGHVNANDQGYFGMVQITNDGNTPGLYADRSDVTSSGNDFRYNARWTLEAASAPEGVTQYYIKNVGCSTWHGIAAQQYSYIYGDNNNLGEVFCSRTKQDNSFYKWSIVSKTEILEVLNAELADAYGGLSASVTFLIKNQGFYCKNNGGGWNYTTTINNAYANYGKLTSLVGGANNNDQMSFGKYYHLNLGGTGYLNQTIQAPRAGLYHIYCQGFDSNEGATFYAIVTGNGTGIEVSDFQNYNDYETNPGHSKTLLKPTSLTSNSPQYVADYQQWNETLEKWEVKPQTFNNKVNLAAGVAFYKGEYTNDLFVYVPEDNQYITICIHKTKSSTYTAVDDFHAIYMGKSAFVFDEEETYGEKILNSEPTHASELEVAKNATMQNTTILLRRGMTVGQWNTLVLPFDLSATAFKRAFGETTTLAECTGLDQNNPNIITFQTKDMTSDYGTIIEKGKFYLVKPGNGPTQLDHDMPYANYAGEMKIMKNGTEFFNLGRRDFSGGENDSRDWTDDSKTTIKTPESELYEAANHNHNSIQLKGTYYLRDNFTDGDQRLYSDSPANQKYVFGHKGDTYAMWRLGTTPRAIKGTRWWIEDVYSSGGAKDMMLLSFNGVVDGDETLAIDMEEGFTPVVRMDNKVYNLNGQVVNATLESLPRGIYVVNGKKFVVK